jgi:SAM-dependent methyltransferase
VYLVAVELGSKLAAVARRNLSRFNHAEVVVADFDEWPLPDTPFDLVVTATAFHWLDPDTRIRKCADALLPGGTLAIVDTRWGVGDGDDPFFAASQPCWARWDPDHDPAFRAPRPEDIPEQRDDLSSSGLFEQITLRRYVCAREYTAAGYCDLLGTFSNVLVLDEPSRIGLLACIADLIQSGFGGTVVRHDLYDLWLARKKTPEHKEEEARA